MHALQVLVQRLKAAGRGNGILSEMGRLAQALMDDDTGYHGESGFRRTLIAEVRRTQRTKRPFLLTLLHLEKFLDEISARNKFEVLERLMEAISGSTRETDARGWFTAGQILGIIYVDLSEQSDSQLCEKLRSNLNARLGEELAALITIDSTGYPPRLQEGDDGLDATRQIIESFVNHRTPDDVMADAVKRGIDVVGSLMAILLFSPLFLAIATIVKCTSQGPVLFRQIRLGYGGMPFVFLKFRSMYVNANDSLHRDYVTRLIRGDVTSDNGVYKIQRDPRVTPFGRLLRQTSLDELPQLFNVLSGDMTLVGPRPPIPYEVESYDLWHKRRILEAKPGLTGPWQISARSTANFDEMVRIDLRYAKKHSIWKDLALIFRTPVAMMSGRGAY